ncbi:MAG: SUMF1/EgtB/PvdO family nonheme iron enzyme [Myxococcota bacterium]
MSDEYDVFLSHTNHDESEVEVFAQRLRSEAELHPYFRRWMLVPGEQWVPALEQAIESSKTVAVFFGPGGADAWRDQESQLALIDQSKSRVIPVLLPGASKDSIDGFLRARTWVDLTDHDGFERLIAGVTGQAPELIIGFDPGPALRQRLGDSPQAGWPGAAEPAAPTPYRVFLSSTMDHDADLRDQLLETIQEVGMVVVPQEPLASGAGTAALEARRKQLESCDLFLMMVSWRYGDAPPDHDRSLIELEYEWALEQKIPRLVFLIDEQQPVVVGRAFDALDQRWAKQSRLQALKSRLEAEEVTIRFTPENVGSKVTHNLHEWRQGGAMKPVRPLPLPAEAPAADEPPPSNAASPENDGPSPAKPKRSKAPKRQRTATPSSSTQRRPARDVSGYLELVEQDSATTTMLGPSALLENTLRIDDLRVKVRPTPARSTDDDAPDTEEPDFELHQVFQQAAKKDCRVVVLVGPPGSGKSTHLRRVALWLARRNPKTLGLPVDTVPIVLPLHELPPELEDLHDAITTYLQRDSRVDASLIDALLKRKHLLFLVDGFDELPTHERRERVTRWIDQGLREHPRARFMLTQRPLEPGSEGRWSTPVLEVQLPPLGKAEAENLIVRWFRASDEGLSASEARRRAEALSTQLEAPEFRATRMFELARNPLMLTVLCAVFHQRGGLPARRGELYEQCLQVLLHKWRGRGELPRRFGDREAHQLLQPLAYWLHEERGRTHADAASIARVIEPHLNAALAYDDPVDAEAFLKNVSTEDGILCSKESDSYGLLHLCFQEYLCARHLRSLSHGDPSILQRLAEHFGDPWWREVTILLLALGEPALFVPTIREVLKQPMVGEHLELLVDCLREAADASIEPFLEYLLTPSDDSPEHWPGQIAAAQLLKRVQPDRLSTVSEQLARHPHEPLRRLFLPEQRPEPQHRVSTKSGYGLVLIPAECFKMGSHGRERGRKGSEGPRHDVELDRFFMGTHPVTNEEYGYYLRANPKVLEPKYWGDGRYNQPRQPVVGVSWHEAKAYCEWAGLSLPTEAQWERAARGGTRTAFWSGWEDSDLARVGWYADNSEQRLHLVGELDANPLGLYDVHGNVWEWCLDEFGDYRGCPPRTGDGLRHPPLENGNRVIRGGCWIDPARKARSAYRLNRNADNRVAYLGFRAVEPDSLDDLGDER